MNQTFVFNFFFKVDSSVHFPHFARAVQNFTGNFAIFRFPFVCHVLLSATAMSCPSFSPFRYVSLLTILGKHFGRIYAYKLMQQ